MKYRKVLRKKVISPDGKVIAEASSRVVISGDNHTQSSQSVSVRTTHCNSSSRSSSRSRAN